MKKFFLSALFLASAGLGFISCSNGDYDANPDGSYANGVNPLNPTGGIDNSFGWGGTDPMSLELNGNAWKADTALLTQLPNDSKHYFITGYKETGDDTAVCTIYLQSDVQVGKSYFVFYGNTENTASFTTNISDPAQIYASTMTNLGEVRILEHDATHIKGLFYFLAKSGSTNQYINIQKGYFNVKKP